MFLPLNICKGSFLWKRETFIPNIIMKIKLWNKQVQMLLQCINWEAPRINCAHYRYLTKLFLRTCHFLFRLSTSVHYQRAFKQEMQHVSDDDLVDIWWHDFLKNFSMLIGFTRILKMSIIDEWTDERHCSSWTLVSLLEIRIFNVFYLEHKKQ
jgi:hypothetical protein